MQNRHYSGFNEFLVFNIDIKCKKIKNTLLLSDYLLCVDMKALGLFSRQNTEVLKDRIKYYI